MTAGEAFQAGDLDAAIAAQTAEVREHPGDPDRRVFLFELLSFAGDLDRARKQIDAVSFDDPERSIAAASYRALMDSEVARLALFSKGTPPKFLAEPAAHVRLRLDAVDLLRDGRAAEAAEALARANDEAPALSGTLDGTAFDVIRDGDDLFGTVLEVMAHGEYFWVPLEQVETLAMVPPKSPRDLIWRPARIEMAGSSGDVFLPALYPGTPDHPDHAIRLGRSTDWPPISGDVVRGVGLRTFLVGDDVVDVLRWRSLQVDPTPEGTD